MRIWGPSWGAPTPYKKNQAKKIACRLTRCFGVSVGGGRNHPAPCSEMRKVSEHRVGLHAIFLPDSFCMPLVRPRRHSNRPGQSHPHDPLSCTNVPLSTAKCLLLSIKCNVCNVCVVNLQNKTMSCVHQFSDPDIPRRVAKRIRPIPHDSGEWRRVEN